MRKISLRDNTDDIDTEIVLLRALNTIKKIMFDIDPGLAIQIMDKCNGYRVLNQLLFKKEYQMFDDIQDALTMLIQFCPTNVS